MKKRQVVLHGDIPFRQVDWGLTKDLVGPERMGSEKIRLKMKGENSRTLFGKIWLTGMLVHCVLRARKRHVLRQSEPEQSHAEG